MTVGIPVLAEGYYRPNSYLDLPVTSSLNRASLCLSTIELPGSDVSAKQGLNCLASLNMAGLGGDELLGLKSVSV